MLHLLHSFLLLFLCLPLFAAEVKSTQIKSVKVKPISELILQQQYTAPAKVIAIEKSKLYAQISATVELINFSIFQQVSQGDSLVQLDCSKPQLNHKIQQTQLTLLDEQINFSRKQLKRANQLKKDKNISQELIDQYKTDLEQLLINKKLQKQRLDLSQIDIDNCYVKAPYDGVIIEKLTSIGTLVSPSSPLLEIISTENLELEVAFNENQQPPNTGIYKTKTKDYQVNLMRTSPEITTSSKSRFARYQINSHDLIIGESGYLYWQSKDKQLPSEYLVKRNQQYGYFLLNEQAKIMTAEFYPVKNAIPGQINTIDIPLDRKLIIKGHQVLNHKDKVNILNTDEVNLNKDRS